MALEFELNLILPHQNSAIFCRSSIEATIYLIKKQQPNLAAILAKTLTTEPLPYNEEQVDNNYQQSYFIDMNPEYVFEITELLLQLSHDKLNTPTPGLMTLAKSLHLDWLEFANSLATVNK